MREPFSLAAVKRHTAERVFYLFARCSRLFGTLALSAAIMLPSLYSMQANAKTEGVAAPAYSIESAAAVSGLLLDVTRAGKRLVAVGDRGHILYSDDDGQQWLQARVPTQQLLTAVFFVDDRYGWAVGHDALILATRDGGATWMRQFDDIERESPLLDVWFKDRNTGYAVGAYGAIFETTNGGQDWSDISDRLDNEDGYHLNAITAVSDTGLFVVGEMGAMFRSADWGLTWETLEGPYDGSLFGAVGTGKPEHLIVYGLRGHIFRSTDFGETWAEIQVRTENGTLQFGLADASLLANGDVLIVGHGGSVLRSSDNGESFTVFNRADRTSLAGVTSGAGQGLILVGQNGIHKTDANGNDLLDK